MTFIITRPMRDSARFAAAAEAAGHEVLHSPLLDIRFLPGAAVPERPWRAVAITSANGARAIARHPARERLVRATAFTVGPASSKAAEEAGFSDIVQAGGDVTALIAEVGARLDPAEGPILYASGAVTRGDLEGELGAAGFEVERVVFYEAVRARELAGPVRAWLAAGGHATVALYSPRSAKVWSALVEAAGLYRAGEAQAYACLSENVARALREAFPEADIMVPERPDEAALLEMLGLPLPPRL